MCSFTSAESGEVLVRTFVFPSPDISLVLAECFLLLSDLSKSRSGTAGTLTPGNWGGMKRMGSVVLCLIISVAICPCRAYLGVAFQDLPM